MGVEADIQLGIVYKLQRELPRKVRVIAFSGDIEDSGLPAVEVSVNVGFVMSRSIPADNRFSASGNEEYVYLCTLKSKNLRSEEDPLNLMSEIKGILRGYIPIQANPNRIYQALYPAKSTFEGYDAGIWEHSIELRTTLIRKPNDENCFSRLPPPEDWWDNDTPINPNIPLNITIETGIYRSKIGNLEENIKDRGINLEFEDS